MTLEERCKRLENINLNLRNASLFEHYDIPEGYPWVDKTTGACNMYACLYCLPCIVSEDPRILEIGTGWGISGLMWGEVIETVGELVSLDCGNFEGQDNVAAARKLWKGNFRRWNLYRVDTQRRWPGALVARLHRRLFDILFIDGDHGDEDRPWALFNDLWQFWPLLRPGGLCICDDMHDPEDYAPGRFPWLGYTWASFHRFAEMKAPQITDRYVWKYPYVPSGKRPIGLLRKA